MSTSIFPTTQGFVIDTETTGLKKSDRMLELCIVRISMQSCEEDIVYNTGLLKSTGPPISTRVTQINGISEAMRQAENNATFSDHAEQIFQLLNGQIWIGYNVTFDQKVIQNEFELIGQTAPVPSALVCVLKLVKKKFNSIGGSNNKLSTVAAHFGMLQMHRAQADCFQTLEVFKRVCYATVLKEVFGLSHMAADLPESSDDESQIEQAIDVVVESQIEQHELLVDQEEPRPLDGIIEDEEDPSQPALLDDSVIPIEMDFIEDNGEGGDGSEEPEYSAEEGENVPKSLFRGRVDLLQNELVVYAQKHATESHFLFSSSALPLTNAGKSNKFFSGELMAVKTVVAKTYDKGSHPMCISPSCEFANDAKQRMWQEGWTEKRPVFGTNGIIFETAQKYRCSSKSCRSSTNAVLCLYREEKLRHGDGSTEFVGKAFSDINLRCAADSAKYGFDVPKPMASGNSCMVTNEFRDLTFTLLLTCRTFRAVLEHIKAVYHSHMLQVCNAYHLRNIAQSSDLSQSDRGNFEQKFDALLSGQPVDTVPVARASFLSPHVFSPSNQLAFATTLLEFGGKVPSLQVVSDIFFNALQQRIPFMQEFNYESCIESNICSHDLCFSVTGPLYFSDVNGAQCPQSKALLLIVSNGFIAYATYATPSGEDLRVAYSVYLQMCQQKRLRRARAAAGIEFDEEKSLKSDEQCYVYTDNCCSDRQNIELAFEPFYNKTPIVLLDVWHFIDRFIRGIDGKDKALARDYRHELHSAIFEQGNNSTLRQMEHMYHLVTELHKQEKFAPLFVKADFQNTLKNQLAHIAKGCLCDPPTGLNRVSEDGTITIGRGSSINESVHAYLKRMMPQRCGVQLGAMLLTYYIYMWNVKQLAKKDPGELLEHGVSALLPDHFFDLPKQQAQHDLFTSLRASMKSLAALRIISPFNESTAEFSPQNFLLERD